MAIGQTHNKTPRHYKVSALFMFIVLVITALIYTYSMVLEAQNSSSREELSDLNTKIGILRSDEKVQAYELYSLNKERLEQLSYLSNIPLFYREVKNMGKEYGVSFSDFSYSQGIVSTAVLSKSNSFEDGYEKISTLIADYRNKEGERKDSIYELGFVRSFLGTKNISSNFQLLVQPEKKKIKEEKAQKISDITEEILKKELQKSK